MSETPEISGVKWAQSFRLIASKFPPISLFDDIADPHDWEMLARAESRTNPRILQEIGDISLVPPERRVNGTGASYLMAPFTHISIDRPSRFSDGQYGVYYAAKTIETAIHETAYHRARFLSATGEAPGWIVELRELMTPVDCQFHALDRGGYAAALDPDDYCAGQALGRLLRAAGSNGIYYPSVRHEGGECVAIFWPDLLAPPRQSGHWQYHWDGARINYVRKLAIGNQPAQVYELAAS